MSQHNQMLVNHNESSPICHHIKSHPLLSKHSSNTMKHLVNDILQMVEEPRRSRINKSCLSITEDLKTRKTCM